MNKIYSLVFLLIFGCGCTSAKMISKIECRNLLESVQESNDLYQQYVCDKRVEKIEYINDQINNIDQAECAMDKCMGYVMGTSDGIFAVSDYAEEYCGEGEK